MLESWPDSCLGHSTAFLYDCLATRIQMPGFFILEMSLQCQDIPKDMVASFLTQFPAQVIKSLPLPSPETYKKVHLQNPCHATVSSGEV